MRQRIDLIGKRFGKVVVEKYMETKNGQAYYLCKCDCGNTAVLRGDTLRSGKTSSCGCGYEESKKKFGSRVAKHWIIDGVEYNSLEIIDKFGIPNASLYRKLKQGKTIEEIIAEYKKS